MIKRFVMPGLISLMTVLTGLASSAATSDDARSGSRTYLAALGSVQQNGDHPRLFDGGGGRSSPTVVAGGAFAHEALAPAGLDKPEAKTPVPPTPESDHGGNRRSDLREAVGWVGAGLLLGGFATFVGAFFVSAGPVALVALAAAAVGLLLFGVSL